MAARLIPAQHRLFIPRADWRDAAQYPPASLRDPSIWSWELLRRNNEYAQDYAQYRHRYADVPAIPYPKDSLLNYVCEPLPASPKTRYATYVEQHPAHVVYPVRDYIRSKWHINWLIDPEKDFTAVIDRNQIHDQHNKLAWLFACNTVDVLNPPSNALGNQHYIVSATAACASNEMLVRLSLTGNLDEQIESLRRQIIHFFGNGSRNGALIRKLYSDPGKSPTAKYSRRHRRPIDTDHHASLDSPLIETSPNWNTLPAKQKTLHYIVRMADAIAAMEQGKLGAQLKADRSDIAGLRIDANDLGEPTHLFYPQEHEDVYPRMSAALAEYFDQQQLPDDAPDISAKVILKWLFLANQLVYGRDFQLIARTNARLDR
ncbi:transcriptional regulator domain-containing protein [Burkholderia pseudomallei]|uniref:transcriptional regulator domain-containing protein n=1 Tax=Burkholderia pseudomallei TaxID=28450 RepID=UPI000A1A0FC6|nr:hypothetical protein [Burkholderia pseudomallei]ARL17560.1 hypothetical protein BOC46_20155 [Burkholderia pseudomallei]